MVSGAGSAVVDNRKAAIGRGMADEDLQRASLYRLIAHLLSSPPARSDIALVAGLDAEAGTTLGDAVNALADSARSSDPDSASDDFQRLFIGLGRGVLVPYGSYYLTGFLHEKPLARLRQEMANLGIVRTEGVSEPEDHIASVLEMMAGLIDGSFGDVSRQDQRRFFEAHVASWAGHFFRDLVADGQSPLYAGLGGLGGRFMEIEERAFRLS